MTEKYETIAVVLASGQGKRMGNAQNKIFLKIAKRPLLWHVLTILEKSRDIQRILIVTRPQDVHRVRHIIQKSHFKKITDILSGGKERQDSAFLAIKHIAKRKLSSKSTFLLFHNGANPFFTQDEIHKCLRMTQKFGACAVAHPTKDTIKQVDKHGMVVKTLDRSSLWNMQTPQAMRFDLALRAFTRAYKVGFRGTDDVSLVEKIKGQVKVIQASPHNFKITFPQDLELAKIIHTRRKRETY